MITLAPKTLPDDVPLNLLPATLPEILHGDQSQASPANSLVTDDALQSDTRSNPEDLSGKDTSGTESTSPEQAPIPGSRVLRDPETAIAALDLQPTPDNPDHCQPTVVGIIDAGITFWNPVFRDDRSTAACRFDTIGALSDGPAGAVSNTILDAAAIATMLATDDHEIRKQLAVAFPDSIFGDTSPVPLFGPEGLAHGTAMADLVQEFAQDHIRFHGLELPVAVLRDLTGGQMSAIMNTALNAIVAQAASSPALVNKTFNMIVLMAFGFTGGPQDGTAEILGPVEATLSYLRTININVTLVLPVGNQLQDQLHARLEQGGNVGWRVLPDDHSVNTVEIIQDVFSAALQITAPNGDQVALPSVPGLFGLHQDGRPIGAVWSKEINGERLRTRISLAPTAASRLGPFPAPFGRWSFSSATADAKLWILRDETGFEASLSQPARASWFEDDAYRAGDETGYPLLEDPQLGAPSTVRRDGAASLLATSASPEVVVVSANHGSTQPAFYASQKPPAAQNFVTVDLASAGNDDSPSDALPIGCFIGRAVLGNAGPRRFRIAGTSLAAAIHAGRLAV